MWVYMIRNKGNKLYVGITENPKERLNYHNEKRGALFTKNNPSFSIEFVEKHPDLKSARKREKQIKKWRREKKEFLIQRYKLGQSTI